MFQLYMEAAPAGPDTTQGLEGTEAVDKGADDIEAQAKQAEDEVLGQTKRMQRSTKEMISYLLGLNGGNVEKIRGDLERLYGALEKDGAYQKAIEAARTAKSGQ